MTVLSKAKQSKAKKKIVHWCIDYGELRRLNIADGKLSRQNIAMTLQFCRSLWFSWSYDPKLKKEGGNKKKRKRPSSRQDCLKGSMPISTEYTTYYAPYPQWTRGKPRKRKTKESLSHSMFLWWGSPNFHRAITILQFCRSSPYAVLHPGNVPG